MGEEHLNGANTCNNWSNWCHSKEYLNCKKPLRPAADFFGALVGGSKQGWIVKSSFSFSVWSIQTVSQSVMLQQSSMSNLTPSWPWKARWGERSCGKYFQLTPESAPPQLFADGSEGEVVDMNLGNLYQLRRFWFSSPFPDYPWPLLQLEEDEGESSKKKEKDGRGDSKTDDEDVEAGHADIEQGDDVPIRWVRLQLASVSGPAGRAEAFRSTFHHPENCAPSVWSILLFVMIQLRPDNNDNNSDLTIMIDIYQIQFLWSF